MIKLENCRPALFGVALLLLLSAARAQDSDSNAGPAPVAVRVPQSISAEAQAYLKSARTGEIPESDLSDPEVLPRLRTMLGNMFLRFANQISSEYELTDETINGIPVIWVNTPQTQRKDKVIIYLHGGGYILGSAQTNLGGALRIGSSAGIPVLSVDYRLAPEHPFPDGLDDALAVYRGVLEQGYRPEDMVVYGDSAGGGLALALTLQLRAEGIGLPAAVAVLSPLADVTPAGDTQITLGDVDPVLRNDGKTRYSFYYGEHDPAEPLISPVYADFTGFPPLLIQVGTRERLLSDSVRLARQARIAGVNVTLDVWEGMWHGWHERPDLPEADQASAEVAGFFLQHLN